MDGWMDGCLDGCMHAWMYGCMYVCTFGAIFQTDNTYLEPPQITHFPCDFDKYYIHHFG